jgi:hypothetical protein
MHNRRHTLTPEVTEIICGYIRHGGSPDVAAEAAGIPVEIFQKWMTKGQAQKAREPYRSFASQVRQALAQCTMMAEINVRKKDPLFWLQKRDAWDHRS